MDNLNESQRSYCMSHIRAKNTKPELVVRQVLHKLGYRFRLHRRDLSGVPDIVLPRYRTVIFVHGCFWHQHPGCNRARVPRSNIEYWSGKLATNIERNKEAITQLELSGWQVLIIWECETEQLEHLTTRILWLLSVSGNPTSITSIV